MRKEDLRCLNELYREMQQHAMEEAITFWGWSGEVNLQLGDDDRYFDNTKTYNDIGELWAAYIYDQRDRK